MDKSSSGEDTKSTLVVRERQGGHGRTIRPSDVLVTPVHEQGHAGRRKDFIGATLGSYKLLEVLGEGAVGRVYLAEHALLGRKVALKMLHPEFGSDPEQVRRFFAEAKTVTQIQHENIVSITDFVVSDAHPSFYIMELLKGQSLQGRLTNGPQMTLEAVIEIISQLCGALSAAHAHGVIHRDIKPANIFITEREGEVFVKLLDFGVAKLTEDLTASPQSLDTRARGVTMTGTLVGTPEYMAPEATFGKEMSPAADIYALGVVLYEMLVGRTPFRGETIREVLDLHRTCAPVRPSEARSALKGITAPLDALVMDCLAKREAERPASAAEVRARLSQLAQARPSLPAAGLNPKLETEQDPDLEPGLMIRTSSPTLAWGLGALMLIAIGVIAFVVAAGRSPKEAGSPPVQIKPIVRSPPQRPQTPEPPAPPKAPEPQTAQPSAPPTVSAPPEAPPALKTRARKTRAKSRRRKRSIAKRNTAPPPPKVEPPPPKRDKPSPKIIRSSDTLNPFQN